MKAIAKTYTVPDAAVQAIAAGCDGLLICSGDVDVQAATLEALVHAVEQDAIPYKRARGRADAAAAREGAVPGRAGRDRQRAQSLRQVLGCDAHRRIADEMARFLVMPCASREPLQARRSHRGRRAGQPVRARRVRRGVAEIAAARLRAGLRRLRLRARVRLSRRARRRSRAERIHAGTGTIRRWRR